MNPAIEVREDIIDVIWTDVSTGRKVRLLASINKSYASGCHTVVIEDMQGNEEGSDFHKAGIGSLIVVTFLRFIIKEYGPNTKVTGKVFHPPGDSDCSIANRVRFWGKFGMYGGFLVLADLAVLKWESSQVVN